MLHSEDIKVVRLHYTVLYWLKLFSDLNPDGVALLNNQGKSSFTKITMPKVKLSLLEANTFIY